MAFRLSTCLFLLSLSQISLILCRTPDETSPPTAPIDLNQISTSPAVMPKENVNFQESNFPNHHPYNQHKIPSNNSPENQNNTAEQKKKATTTTSNGCFHRGPEYCPIINENNKCRCKQLPDNDAAVVCCDVTENFLIEDLKCANVIVTDKIKELHIRNASLTDLKVNLTNFRRLISLSITDGRIQRVVEQFLYGSTIQCLNLSSNGLESIEKRALTRLRHLYTLDLSHNNLTAVPNLSSNISLDISGNNEMPCQSLLQARNNNSELNFENVNNTYCSISKTFHWFNSTELLPLKQVEEFFNAQRNCWPNCTCEFYRMDYVEGKVPTIAFKVDCSGKQLTEMPSELPKNTIVLNISNNNISVLKMDNESFGNIRELYADNNQIKSLLYLEGTKFLDNFVALSLRNNSLKTLPSYMLSYIFDRNANTRLVHLGLNKLHCDCNTAKNLRVWLLTKQKYILDYDEIFCENSPQKVIYLDPANMCQDSQQNWTDYIYYIITAEVLLLVCLILKVSYDYWVFKTAGYLPWPANKMPKLPCDWLCE